MTAFTQNSQNIHKRERERENITKEGYQKQYIKSDGN